MTIKTAIEITVNLLGNIAVPRNLNETVGIPIDSAIANLNMCLDAIRQDEEAQQAKEEKTEG